MQLDDYILNHDRVDWPVVLRDWASLLPPSMTVWIMNRFGDPVLVFEDGTIHLLDVGGGTVTKIAESRDDLIRLIDEGDNADQWLMIPLIDRLVAAGLTLQEGQCYSYTKPPMIGGDYTVENTWVAPITDHFAFLGSIHRQVKDLPDGTWVELVVKPE